MPITAAVLANVGLQDGLGWDDIFWFTAGATTVITFLGLFLRPLVREVREYFAWWRKFQRDWDGEPGDDGRAPVAGVMARLNRIDGELQRNGGSSMKDQVFHVARIVDEMDARVTTIEHRQCEIQQVQYEMAQRMKDAGG